MKRYSLETEVRNIKKNDESTSFEVGGHMSENDYGEYICVDDLPSWVRIILRLRDKEQENE